MASKKADSIVEAVKYTPEGKVALVRVYQRLGPAYSDRLLLSREQLLDQLHSKKKVVVGTRILMMGTSFDTGAEIRAVKTVSGEYIQSTAGSGERDDLKGVPQI
jgi:purine nucleoside phosphorylase